MPANDDPGATIPLKRPQQRESGPTIAFREPPVSGRGDGAAGSANPDAPLPYVFGHEIARGGMGSILQAEDCKIGRTVAVKIILSEINTSEAQQQRFINEAAVLGRLAHPNIVPVYDIGRDQKGQLYYSMKLVKGRTLQAILNDIRLDVPDTARQYSLAHLLTIFRKACDAVAFAHSKGIIHRDLKPENIMVGEFGEVLVMDWGLAKTLGQKDEKSEEAASSFGLPASALSVTLQGSIIGTPRYMSPEQAEGHVSELDARSDIFSLGGILYSILTLHPPVEGKTVEEVLKKVTSASITPPSAFGAGTGKSKPGAKGEVTEGKLIKPLSHMPGGRVPMALSSVVMKALSVDKAKRYQDVAALSADVEKFQGGFATSAENAGTLTQLKLLMLRHKAVAASLAVMLLLSFGFVLKVMASERKAARNAQIAATNEKLAKASEAVAVQERETARQALAKSQLDLAEKEFERGKFVEAQKILEETPESFRDANWRFLRAHSRDFTAQLSMTGKGSARRLQFMPQGDRFAARCFRGGIGIFTLTGRQIGDWFPVSENGSVTFGIGSAGGRMAFSASANEVAVQEVATGRLVRRWTCEIGEMTHVLMSPDGVTVLAAGGDQLIAYATQTGAPLWTQPFHGVIPAFSPDSKTVAMLTARVGLALKIQFLDTGTGVMRRTLEATADDPAKSTLQFNQAGDRLACLGGDELILWNSRTATKIRALHFPGEKVKLLSPSGSEVASVSGSRIRLWDTTTGRLLRSLNGASNQVADLAFSPDGKVLLSAHETSHDGVVHVWPVRLGEEIASARLGSSPGRRVLFDRDGSKLYACARNAGSWETRSGLQKWKLTKEPGSFHDLAIQPADGSIILTERDQPAFTHLSPTGEAWEAFGASRNSSVKFSRGGQFLLAVEGAFSPTDPGTAFSVMEYPTGKILRKITLENPHQPFAAFCHDDAAVATAAIAGGITVWDWKAGTPLRQIAAAQTGSIGCLAASPDGLHLASGGPDRWIRVWEVATGRLESAFRAHWEGVRCVKFSPDGREILSGSEDGAVRLQDASTGEERLAFYGHTTPVVDVDFSSDGMLIGAIAIDGVTKVWDRNLSSAAAPMPRQPSAK